MTYKPFQTFAPAFSIGLSPVAADIFLHFDEDLPRYLTEKHALYETCFNEVCRAEVDTQAAQQEVYDLIFDQVQRHPSFRREGDVLHIAGLDQPVSLNVYPTFPIASAGYYIQDDLLLLRRDDSGWRLVAASLSFPSSWHLDDKFGHPLDFIHKPVPGMEGRMSNMINRIFDNLQPSIPVWRENWSLDGDRSLRHARRENERNGPGDKLSGTVYARTEYQTLHKLPVSGDILFTVRIFVRSLEELKPLPQSKTLFANLQNQFESLSNDQKAYKGLLNKSERLSDWLQSNGGRDG